MIVNLGRLQAILLNKSKSTYTKETMNIGNEKIQSLSSAKLQGIETDNKLNFNNHIKYAICRSTTTQLNNLIRLRCFSGLEERKVSTQSFVQQHIQHDFDTADAVLAPKVWCPKKIKSKKT